MKTDAEGGIAVGGIGAGRETGAETGRWGVRFKSIEREVDGVDEICWRQLL